MEALSGSCAHETHRSGVDHGGDGCRTYRHEEVEARARLAHLEDVLRRLECDRLDLVLDQLDEPRREVDQLGEYRLNAQLLIVVDVARLGTTTGGLCERTAQAQSSGTAADRVVRVAEMMRGCDAYGSYAV